MTQTLQSLEPATLWARFQELAGIARPSRREDAALDWIKTWAADRGFAAVSAGGRNLLVRVPASPGRESAPALILQGHTDMVCERDPDSAFDPAEGRIRLVTDGDWLTADGTTLGADDGIGVASMMAVAEGDMPHGPLELLFTTAEEVGLEGAKSVDGSVFTGRLMLNLDSEEDGVLTVGCAGSTDTFLRLREERQAALGTETCLTVTLSGGSGGHSGTNIAQGRANAIKVLARCLREAALVAPFRLVSLDGGKSRNAIPREASALLLVPQGGADGVRAALADAAAAARDEYAKTDAGIALTVGAGHTVADGWTTEAGQRILDVIAAMPSGPLAMSPDFPGLVETSTSLGVATTDGAAIELHSLTRTSNESALGDVTGALAGIAELAGGELEVRHGYAGWRPDLDSPLLAVCTRVWRDLFGADPVVTAVHAGLETALVGQKVRGIDMLSIGPQIEFPHSPEERVSIPTVERFWRFLVAVVDALSS